MVISPLLFFIYLSHPSFSLCGFHSYCSWLCFVSRYSLGSISCWQFILLLSSSTSFCRSYLLLSNVIDSHLIVILALCQCLELLLLNSFWFRLWSIYLSNCPPSILGSQRDSLTPNFHLDSSSIKLQRFCSSHFAHVVLLIFLIL